MRHGTSSRRQRSRNSGRRNNQQRAQVFDSNGPDVRIRGTAHQVAEKYLALAKDASSAGDVIVAENYYQHAEHYIRIINEGSNKSSLSKAANKKIVRNDAAGRNISAQKPTNDVDDLSLPSSILGGEPREKVVEEKECEAVG